MPPPVASSPFTLLGADVLHGVYGLLERALRDWCADWGVTRDELVLETARAWEEEGQLPATPAWRQSWRSAGGAMALTWAAEMPAQLQRLLFAPQRQASPVASAADTAAAAAQAAWTALLQVLAAVAVPGAVRDADAVPPASADWRRASGAVLLAIRLGKHTCHALLDHRAVQALARQAESPGSAKSAPPLRALDYRVLLAPLDVALPVELGRAQVGLGSLMRLEAGDVIRLDTAADRAIRVNNSAGSALFDGYLGLTDGHVALELVRHDLTIGAKQ